MSIQLKYKKLKYEIKYLSAEKEELMSQLQEALPKFEKEFSRLVPNFKQVNEKVKKESQEKTVNHIQHSDLSPTPSKNPQGSSRGFHPPDASRCGKNRAVTFPQF